MFSYLEQEKKVPKEKKYQSYSLLFDHGNIHIKTRPDCNRDSDVTDQMAQGETHQRKNGHH